MNSFSPTFTITNAVTKEVAIGPIDPNRHYILGEL